jgi:hypothetical protein
MGKKHFTDEFGVFGRVGFSDLGGFGSYGLETRVSIGIEDSFCCGELASLLCLAHVLSIGISFWRTNFWTFDFESDWHILFISAVSPFG